MRGFPLQIGLLKFAVAQIHPNPKEGQSRQIVRKEGQSRQKGKAKKNTSALLVKSGR
jgi:hypothetical protein